MTEPEAPIVHVAIISSGRPGNVPAMLAHTDPMEQGATWYVPTDQVADYEYTGAGPVVGVDGGLCAARNAALDAARELLLPCLQLSDDLRRVSWANGQTRADVVPTDLGAVVANMVLELEGLQAQLCGVAPTANPYFSRQRVHRSGFIVGDLILVGRGCPLRFDERLRLKEDYDYTCQHLRHYGQVARLDYVLAEFAHRTNRGGAVAIRTPELEQASIAHLLAKWPASIRPNPRRPNEVLLRWQKGS